MCGPRATVETDGASLISQEIRLMVYFPVPVSLSFCGSSDDAGDGKNGAWLSLTPSAPEKHQLTYEIGLGHGMMLLAVFGKVRMRKAAWPAASRLQWGFAAAFVLAALVALPTGAQMNESPEAQLGQISGTVIDMNGDPVAGATVVLQGGAASDIRTIVTPDSGFFEFDGVRPAVAYHVMIDAIGFAKWVSPQITLDPGQIDILGGISLRIETQNTTVTVRYNSAEVAARQLKKEEKQRILGIIPNFYVAYEGDDTAPLTVAMKFELALKISYDPVTIGGVGLYAGLRQASNSPDYPQGLKGYGERFGATAADGFTDIMIGGAILPSLLHQDPRYFYQGTGSVRSRLRHAILSPFICRGDNGQWQPNYSSVGGDLGSAALSNLYYPESNRGPGLVFSSFAIGTAERVIASVAQEFLLSKLTHRGGHIQQTPGQ